MQPSTYILKDILMTNSKSGNILTSIPRGKWIKNTKSITVAIEWYKWACYYNGFNVFVIH